MSQSNHESGASQEAPYPPSMDQESLKSYGFTDPIHGNTSVQNKPNDIPDNAASPNNSVADTTPTVPENAEPETQEMPYIPKSYNPIVSIEDFFKNDTPLPGHLVEESPCYPIIGSRPGEIPTDIIYYCKLHPDLGSPFPTEIEFHCRQKEPGLHKSEIIRLDSDSAGEGQHDNSN